MNEALQIANGTPMWIACGIPVALIIVQAIVYLRHSCAAAPKVGISDSQLKNAIRSSAITSIGPSIVILSGMLSLLVSVGGPMAWMRLSLIGSVMFESAAAGIGTSTVGVTLGADELTELALTMAVWTMILCSIGWILFATFSANQMDKVQNKITGGDPAKLMALSSAAIIGAFSSMSAQHLIKSFDFTDGISFSLNKSTIACILGGLIMYVLLTITEKKQIRWMRDWNLTFAILGGMIITALLP